MRNSDHDNTFSKHAGLLKNGTLAGSSRTGNRDQNSAWATELRDLAGTLYDVVPSQGKKRVVHLQTEPALGVGASLVFGYNARSSGEPITGNPSKGIPVAIAPDLDTAREFAAYIEFGNGNGRFAMEVDVAEGSRVNVWGDDVEVWILDYSLRPARNTPYWGLENHGAGAYLPGAQGVRTQRCYAPVLVPDASLDGQTLVTALLGLMPGSTPPGGS